MILCCWATGLGLCTTGWCSSPGAALASRRKTHSAKSSGHTLPWTPCLRAGLGLTSAHTHALTPARVCDTSCLHTPYVLMCIPPHTSTRVPMLTCPYLLVHAHHTHLHMQVHMCTLRHPGPWEAWEHRLSPLLLCGHSSFGTCPMPPRVGSGVGPLAHTSPGTGGAPGPGQCAGSHGHRLSAHRQQQLIMG